VIVQSARRFCIAFGVAFAAAFFASLPVARADQPATFISLGESTYQSSQNLDANGRKMPGFCTFNQQSTGIYVSHQFSARDSWFGDTAYNSISCGDVSTRGLTDIEVGEQHGISGPSHPRQWSIKGSILVPSGYPIDANLRLGYGRPGASLGAVYLGSLNLGPKMSGFVTAGAAVKAYTTYPAPQLDTSATVGVHVTPGILLLESYFGSTAIGNGGQVNNLALNPITSTRYSAYQLTEAATFDLSKNIGLNVNVWNLIGGESIGIGTTVGAGLWIKF